MDAKRLGVGVVLGLIGITLISLPYFFTGSAAGSVLQATLWGFIGTLFVILIGVLVFFGARMLGKREKTAEVKRAPAEVKKTPAPPEAPFGSALFDALTNLSTWTWWVVIGCIAWFVGPKIFNSPNWAWIPIGAWMLTAFFSRAKSASLAGAPGSAKDKKAHPVLRAAVKHLESIAILTTIGIIIYYGHVAPTGTWEKVAGVRGSTSLELPGNMVVPEGFPRNPNFTSNKLAGWTATYMAPNMHYRVPQSRWGGQQLALAEMPGRHLTESVDLTVIFGPGNEAFDMRLTGSCTVREDDRRRNVSKTCAGDWVDRWRHISGKFYLEVKEGAKGQRYFDAYLYDGNNIPRRSELAMFLHGAPIPPIMLQFRPKEWDAE